METIHPGEGAVSGILHKQESPDAILREIAQLEPSSPAQDTKSEKVPADNKRAPEESSSPGPESVLVGKAAYTPEATIAHTPEGGIPPETEALQKVKAILDERYTDPKNPEALLENKVDEDFRLALVGEVKDGKGIVTDSVEMQLKTILTPEIWSTLSDAEKKSAETMFRAHAIEKHIEVQQARNAPPLTRQEQETLFKAPWFEEALRDAAHHDDRFRKAFAKEIDFMNLDLKNKKPQWLKKLIELFKKSAKFLVLALALLTAAANQQGGPKAAHA